MKFDDVFNSAQSQVQKILSINKDLDYLVRNNLVGIEDEHYFVSENIASNSKNYTYSTIALANYKYLKDTYSWLKSFGDTLYIYDPDIDGEKEEFFLGLPKKEWDNFVKELKFALDYPVISEEYLSEIEQEIINEWLPDAVCELRNKLVKLTDDAYEKFVLMHITEDYLLQFFEYSDNRPEVHDDGVYFDIGNLEEALEWFLSNLPSYKNEWLEYRKRLFDESYSRHFEATVSKLAQEDSDIGHTYARSDPEYLFNAFIWAFPDKPRGDYKFGWYLDNYKGWEDASLEIGAFGRVLSVQETMELLRKDPDFIRYLKRKPAPNDHPELAL